MKLKIEISTDSTKPSKFVQYIRTHWKIYLYALGGFAGSVFIILSFVDAYDKLLKGQKVPTAVVYFITFVIIGAIRAWWSSLKNKETEKDNIKKTNRDTK